MGDQIGDLLKGVQNKEVYALAKLLSALENLGLQALSFSELLAPPKLSFRLGITGPPGAGKSTLINGLITHFRKKNLSVGVLAVDPSSPFSQGAILGDRIRYQDHFTDKKVFIRSLGTRKSLGGLSASAYLFSRAFDLFGFDIVLIETVGVGQTELDIVHVADLISVVLVPESGDSIQMMKAGLLEIADAYIINKFDRPGAAALAKEVAITCGNGQEKPVFSTIATSNEGLKDWAYFIEERMSQSDLSTLRNSTQRLREEAQSLILSMSRDKACEEVLKINDLLSFQKVLIENNSTNLLKPL